MPTRNSVGRATNRESFLLRENATGKLAGFTTDFAFVIDSQGKNRYANGLAFFLAPSGSLLNHTLGKGSLSIGLPVNASKTHQYPFVAVEFDIHQNNLSAIGDPFGDHVGIDVNSLKSTVTKPWNGSISDGQNNSARISYDSQSKNLSVAFTTYVNGIQVMRYLDYIVDLNQYLPDRVIVGFSAATDIHLTALYKIQSWSFNSTSLVKPKSSGKHAKIGLAAGLGSGGCLLLVFGGFGLFWFIILWKKRNGGETSDYEDPMVHDFNIDDEFEKGTGPRKFSYRELAQGTSNFDEGEKLGEGGFGGVYRGFIKDLNSHVAVKRISSRSKQGMKEYAAEVRIISPLRHRNLVQLIGWCHEKKLILVYEFMPNGSLDSHLFKQKSLLSWEVRYKIALGLASGLLYLYLHQEWEQCVLHRDIKSSNVMLDSNFNAKLGDFGLARLVDHGKPSQTTIVAGTRGYMALEYVTTGKASKESDVYSFGVVALEIACGRKPIDVSLDANRIEMIEWVWELYGRGKVNEAADPKLCGRFDEQQMECDNFRPSIQQAIKELSFEAALPILPSEMPVATFPLPMSSLSTSGSKDSSVFQRL